MKDSNRIHDCLESALDLLVSWIRSSAFPTPQIQRAVTLSENGDQTIKLAIPQIVLSREELEIFSGKKSYTPLGERSILIRGYLSAIAGRLNIHSSKESGTIFEIFIPSVDPLKDFALAERICRKLINLDFTLKEFFWIWKWTRKSAKRFKNRRPAVPVVNGESYESVY